MHIKEKEDYQEKIKKQISSIEKILNIQNTSVLSINKRSELVEIKNECQILLRKLEKNEFEIAIVGLEKAGKSSFSNAVIENNLLPTDDERCTYTATCIKYDLKDSAEVQFYTKNEFERDFIEKLQKIGVEDADGYSYDTLTIEQYDILFEKIDDEKREKYGETLSQDIRIILNNKDTLKQYIESDAKRFTDEELLSEKFQDFIRKPEKAIAVKEVIISSCKLEKMKNAIIFDVPGFNSPTEMHKQQTLEKMKNADAIIVVAKGDEPSITGDVLKIFEEKDNDKVQLKDKLFVFANKSDRATDIQKNINKTYDEWISRWKILNEKDRIVFGSALAHLYDLGKLTEPMEKEQGKNASEGIRNKKLPDGDGIEKITKDLEKYNETVRFKILKNRINELSIKLKDVFEPLKEKCDFTALENYNRSESIRLAFEFEKNFKEKLKKNLEQYKHSLIKEMSEQEPLPGPLSKSIAEIIDSIFSNDAYLISDELIQAESKKLISISNYQQQESKRIESEIRIIKFEEMYNDFSEKIQVIAADKHKECIEKVQEAFIEAIGITQSFPYYIEIKDKVKEFINEFIKIDSEGFYYRCLIERYARDLYEILIYFPYDESRIEKFYAEINNFFSLSIFYNDEDKNSLDYINITPKEQPLCRMLLFHEYVDIEDKNKTMYERIKLVLNLENENNEIEKLIENIANYDISKLVGIVEDILKDFNCSDSLDNKIAMMTTLLENRYMQLKRDKGSIYHADISNIDNFKTMYKKFHAELKKSENQYEDIKSEFKKDVDILHRILTKAFVRAINIEKPFIACESKFIEDIINSLEKERSSKFIENIISYIKFKEFSELDEREKQERANQECYSEINNILQII